MVTYLINHMIIAAIGVAKDLHGIRDARLFALSKPNWRR